LAGGLANALFLLLDVRHGVKTPAIAGSQTIAAGRRGRRAGLLPMLIP